MTNFAGLLDATSPTIPKDISPRRWMLLKGFRHTPPEPTPSMYGALITEVALRSALHRHHTWMLAQSDVDEFGIIPAEAYAESQMCDDTLSALALPESTWVPIAPSTYAKVKNMQYALAYDAEIADLRGRLLELLTEFRRITAAAHPMGAGLSPLKLRKLADDVHRIADEHEECSKVLLGADGDKFCRSALTLNRIVELLEESLQGKAA